MTAIGSSLRRLSIVGLEQTAQEFLAVYPISVPGTRLHGHYRIHIPRYHIADALMRPLTIVKPDVLVKNALQPVQPK